MATVYSMSVPVRSGGDPAWIRGLFTGSILAIVMLSGVPAIEHFFGRKRGRWKSSPLLKEDALHSLRASILGHGRRHVASLLGPPKALGNGTGVTWYYAVDDSERVAMAVQFDKDHARAVEFFRSPG